MHLNTIRPVTVALGVVTLGLAPLVAACAGGQSAASSAPPSSSAHTVSVRNAGGAAVLVAPDGQTLYTNNQDQPMRPMCTSSDCTAIWAPLTVKGGQPTAATAVTGKVASVTLSNGTHQVTWKGMPLYTFSFDHGAGQTNGNGVHDSFAGTNFVWHAAMTQGQQPTQSSNGGSGFSY